MSDAPSEIVVSSPNARLAAGIDVDGRVVVWSSDDLEVEARLVCRYSMGGNRIAVMDAGVPCIVTGSWERPGVQAYGLAGDLLWQRRDLNRVQTVRPASADGTLVAVCRENGPAHVLDVASGETKASLRGGRDVFFEPNGRRALIERSGAVSLEVDGEKAWTRPLVSFALLSVSFCEAVVVLSESGGPVRGLSIDDGAEVWRYECEEGVHYVALSYDEPRRSVIAVAMNYATHAPSLVAAFDREGRMTIVRADILGAVRTRSIVATDGSCSRQPACSTSTARAIREPCRPE